LHCALSTEHSECTQHSVHNTSLTLKCTEHSVLSKQRALSTQCPSPSRHSVLSASIVCGPVPNERNQGKQAHPVIKYRVPHGSQPRPGWAPDPPMVGIRSPIGLVVGSCTSQLGVLGSIPKREEPGKTGAPCVKVPGSSRVPVRDGQTHPHRPRLVVSRSTCPPLSSPPTRAAL